MSNAPSLDTHVHDVAKWFATLTSAQKAELILTVPELYFAVARLTRRYEIEQEPWQ